MLVYLSALEKLPVIFFTEATFKPHDYTGTKPEQIFVHLCNLSARSAWSSCLGVSGLGGKLIERAPPPTSYSLSDFAFNPPLCMNVHTVTIIQRSPIICFSLVIPGPLFQTSVWSDLSATSLWRILGGNYVTGKPYKLALKKIRSMYVKNKSKQTSKWWRKREGCEKGDVSSFRKEPNMGTSSVPTWTGFQTAEDLIIIWLFISLRISASGDPPMWAGTLGLEPSPNLLFHWARATLCSPWWKLGEPVTRDPQPAHPTVRVRRHSPSHTHKAALAKSSSNERTGGPWENDQKTHLYIDTIWLRWEVDGFLSFKNASQILCMSAVLFALFYTQIIT